MAPVPLLRKGAVIDRRFEVEKKIGEGTFSEIYRARDAVSGMLVAVKVEKEESVLKWESNVQKHLQDCEYICRHVQFGIFEDHNFLIMELLGESLSDLRRKQPGGKFSIDTSLRLGIQLLMALKGMHERGYLHRDVKPSNFAIGYGPKHRQCFVIDFGLSKRYKSHSGEVHQPRKVADFRGSSVYASVNAHLLKELGRRDDLWSLFFVIVEFLEGDIPWRAVNDKEKVKHMKLYYTKKPQELFRTMELPDELLFFIKHLQSLEFADAPNYDHLIQLLEAFRTRLGLKDDLPYDWETLNADISTTSSRHQINDHGPSLYQRTMGKPDLPGLTVCSSNSPNIGSNVEESKEPAISTTKHNELQSPGRGATAHQQQYSVGADACLPNGPSQSACSPEVGRYAVSQLQNPIIRCASLARDINKDEASREFTDEQRKRPLTWDSTPSPRPPRKDEEGVPCYQRDNDSDKGSRERVNYHTYDRGIRRDRRLAYDYHAERITDNRTNPRSNDRSDRPGPPFSSFGERKRDRRLCIEVLENGECKRSQCDSAHPLRMTGEVATTLCLDFVNGCCPYASRACSKYHWLTEEEETFRRTGRLPAEARCEKDQSWQHRYSDRVGSVGKSPRRDAKGEHKGEVYGMKQACRERRQAPEETAIEKKGNGNGKPIKRSDPDSPYTPMLCKGARVTKAPSELTSVMNGKVSVVKHAEKLGELEFRQTNAMEVKRLKQGSDVKSMDAVTPLLQVSCVTLEKTDGNIPHSTVVDSSLAHSFSKASNLIKEKSRKDSVSTAEAAESRDHCGSAIEDSQTIKDVIESGSRLESAVTLHSDPSEVLNSAEAGRGIGGPMHPSHCFNKVVKYDTCDSDIKQAGGNKMLYVMKENADRALLTERMSTWPSSKKEQSGNLTESRVGPQLKCERPDGEDGMQDVRVAGVGGNIGFSGTAIKVEQIGQQVARSDRHREEACTKSRDREADGGRGTRLTPGKRLHGACGNSVEHSNDSCRQVRKARKPLSSAALGRLSVGLGFSRDKCQQWGILDLCLKGELVDVPVTGPHREGYSNSSHVSSSVILSTRLPLLVEIQHCETQCQLKHPSVCGNSRSNGKCGFEGPRNRNCHGDTTSFIPNSLYGTEASIVPNDEKLKADKSLPGVSPVRLKRTSARGGRESPGLPPAGRTEVGRLTSRHATTLQRAKQVAAQAKVSNASPKGEFQYIAGSLVSPLPSAKGGLKRRDASISKGVVPLTGKEKVRAAEQVLVKFGPNSCTTPKGSLANIGQSKGLTTNKLKSAQRNQCRSVKAMEGPVLCKLKSGSQIDQASPQGRGKLKNGAVEVHVRGDLTDQKKGLMGTESRLRSSVKMSGGKVNWEDLGGRGGSNCSLLKGRETSMDEMKSPREPSAGLEKKRKLSSFKEGSKSDVSMNVEVGRQLASGVMTNMSIGHLDSKEVVQINKRQTPKDPMLAKSVRKEEEKEFKLRAKAKGGNAANKRQRLPGERVTVKRKVQGSALADGNVSRRNEEDIISGLSNKQEKQGGEREKALAFRNTGAHSPTTSLPKILEKPLPASEQHEAVLAFASNHLKAGGKRKIVGVKREREEATALEMGNRTVLDLSSPKRERTLRTVRRRDFRHCIQVIVDEQSAGNQALAEGLSSHPAEGGGPSESRVQLLRPSEDTATTVPQESGTGRGSKADAGSAEVQGPETLHLVLCEREIGCTIHASLDQNGAAFESMTSPQKASAVENESDSDSFSSLFKEENDSDECDEIQGPAASAFSAERASDEPPCLAGCESVGTAVGGGSEADPEGEQRKDSHEDEEAQFFECRSRPAVRSRSLRRLSSIHRLNDEHVKRRMNESEMNSRQSGDCADGQWSAESREVGGDLSTVKSDGLQNEYRCHFNWSHYAILPPGLSPQPQSFTELYREITDVFIKALEEVYYTEVKCGILGEDGVPRNILKELSAHPQRTRVFSGDHNADTQNLVVTDDDGHLYWSLVHPNDCDEVPLSLLTVLRSDLRELGICPNLVEFETLDADGSRAMTSLTQQPWQCLCGEDDAAQQDSDCSHREGRGRSVQSNGRKSVGGRKSTRALDTSSHLDMETGDPKEWAAKVGLQQAAVVNRRGRGRGRPRGRGRAQSSSVARTPPRQLEGSLEEVGASLGDQGVNIPPDE